MVEQTAPRGGDKRKAAIVGAGVAALALLAWMVTGQTVAGFTARTENAGNEFTAGEVSISDDANGTALFTIGDMLPGHSMTKTITVSNDATTPLKVKLFAADVVETADVANNPDRAGATTDLAENLDLTINIVRTGGGKDLVFAGTLADLETSDDWDSGESFAKVTDAEGTRNVGDPIAADTETGDTLTYEIVATLKATAGNDDQQVWPGDEVKVTFVWEGRA